MFHVKICGVTTPADAALVAAAGADAVGINFVAGSPRRLDVAAARNVARAIPAGVLKVGVFVGTTALEIARVVAEVGLDAVQLHGHLFGADPAVDPPARAPELARLLPGLKVIRAVRMDPTTPATPGTAGTEGDPLASVRRWLAAATALGAGPGLVIVDAPVARDAAAGQLGGTGACADWSALAAAPPLGVPTALAGGLTPENVAAAIRSSGLGAVDTASGVESAPGRKDPAKVRAFVAAARAAARSR